MPGMTRFFNTAGPCRPEDHYMVPPEPRLPQVRQLIEEKLYFVIHAPRQTGKTTSLNSLARQLAAEHNYAVVHASCERGQSAGSNVERGVQAVLRAIELQAESLPLELRPEPLDDFHGIEAESRLRTYLTRWCERSARPAVLFLDEIDALQGDTLISVLRQVREGYPDRPHRFPQSVALIGLRDVRDYKAQMGPDAETLGTASPFNIKAESLTLLDFTAEEVSELLGQHTADTGQPFTEEAQTLCWDLTQGQPWMVNALARQAVTRPANDVTRPITAAIIEQAKEVLIRRRDTHLDSLIDRLREPRVRKVIEPILTGRFPADDVLDDDVHFVKDLGLVASRSTGLEISNPIYREIIPRALTAVSEEYFSLTRADYIDVDRRLDLAKLLDGFVAFWLENAEWMLRRQPYSEAAAQLVFMAFLHKVVNGGGTMNAVPAGAASIDREYAVGSGRVDLLIRWPLPDGHVQRLALELKVWRDGDVDPQGRGLDQLSQYLERLSLDRGTLVIFDQRQVAPKLPERCATTQIEHQGRQITVLRL